MVPPARIAGSQPATTGCRRGRRTRPPGGHGPTRAARLEEPWGADSRMSLPRLPPPSWLRVHGPRVGCGRPAGSRRPPASFGVCCSVCAVALSQRPGTVPGALRPRSPPPEHGQQCEAGRPHGRGSDVLADVVAHRQDASPWVAAVADTRYWPTVLAWNVATAVPRRPGSTSSWTSEVAALTATAAPSGPVTCSPSCCQDGVALPWEGTALVALVFPGPPRRGSASAGGVGRAGDLRGALVGRDRGAGVGDRTVSWPGITTRAKLSGRSERSILGQRQQVGDNMSVTTLRSVALKRGVNEAASGMNL
jgi:hypothetical protein